MDDTPWGPTMNRGEGSTRYYRDKCRNACRTAKTMPEPFIIWMPWHQGLCGGVKCSQGENTFVIANRRDLKARIAEETARGVKVEYR